MGMGVVFAVVAVDGVAVHGVAGLLMPLAVRVFPLIVGVVIVVCAFETWMDKFAAQIKADGEASARQRLREEERLRQRAEHLDRREDALNRATEAAEGRLALLTKSLEEARVALLAEKKDRGVLQADFDELAEDYNRMVTDTLRQRANFFARPAAPADPAAPPAPVHHILVPQRDGGAARPVLRDAADPVS
ncbi:hypothetical protein EES44_24725 [Streptomyces sp. ADI96-15]|nr:hypothetical protein [Streptomyces sp. CZ24]RPK57936.1 hypothetical protein EES44_24725 [Streptomyces sp. ADI96-15]